MGRQSGAGLGASSDTFCDESAVVCPGEAVGQLGPVGACQEAGLTGVMKRLAGEVDRRAGCGVPASPVPVLHRLLRKGTA